MNGAWLYACDPEDVPFSPPRAAALVTGFDWDQFFKYVPFVAQGLPITIAVAAGAIAIGSSIGMLISILRLSSGWVSVLAAAYVEVFRNTPVLVLVVWFYYALPIVLGVDLGPAVAGTLALGMNASAYLAEVFRAGIQSLAVGQTEAARSLGMSHAQTLRHVIVPQAVRKMVPPFANTCIYLTKETAVVAFIGVLEIVHRGQVVVVTNFRPLETYTLVAVVYLALILVMSRSFILIERRVRIVE